MWDLKKFHGNKQDLKKELKVLLSAVASRIPDPLAFFFRDKESLD